MSMTGRKIRNISADNAFDCKAMAEFASENKIELKFRPSNSSRSVLVETYHKFLHSKIAAFTGNDSRDFCKVLHKAVIALNAQVSDVTMFSPYYLFYGRQPGTINDVDFSENAYDKHHLQNLLLAQQFTNAAKAANTPKYTFRTLKVDSEVEVRYDNSKNSESLKATILEDRGGATVIVKLQNRSRPIVVHKRHICIPKSAKEYDLYFGKYKTDKVFEAEPQQDEAELQIQESQNVSHENVRFTDNDQPRYNLRSRSK